MTLIWRKLFRPLIRKVKKSKICLLFFITILFVIAVIVLCNYVILKSLLIVQRITLSWRQDWSESYE